jgi:hypothetical protein
MKRGRRDEWQLISRVIDGTPDRPNVVKVRTTRDGSMGALGRG